MYILPNPARLSVYHLSLHPSIIHLSSICLPGISHLPLHLWQPGPLRSPTIGNETEQLAASPWFPSLSSARDLVWQVPKSGPILDSAGLLWWVFLAWRLPLGLINSLRNSVRQSHPVSLRPPLPHLGSLCTAVWGAPFLRAPSPSSLTGVSPIHLLCI